MALSEETRARIESLLRQNENVLFMKGNRQMPRCGFSATVVQILEGLGVPYQEVDVLADPAIREGIKEFGNWPTIPQLYHRGSLIGGCDILRELDQSGELAGALEFSPAAVAPPEIRLSERAAAMIREAAAQGGPGLGLRLIVRDGGRGHELMLSEREAGDVAVETGGVTFLLDRASARLANGVSIDFVDDPRGGGFAIDNPNGPPKVRALGPRELKARLDAGEPLRLYDVRPEGERRLAAIPGSIPLDDRTQATLGMLPKDTMLVFVCHHGQRSQMAAESFLQRGFRNVWNLRGGVDAWALEVDPSVPRY